MKHQKVKKKNEECDMECTYGKFSVNIKNKKDGKVYYREYLRDHTS